jgi:hypothetical protein
MKKRLRRRFFENKFLYRSLDLTAPETARAYQDLFRGAVNDSFDTLQVWSPGSFGADV